MGLFDKLLGRKAPAEIKEEAKIEKPKAEPKPRKPRAKKPKPEPKVETPAVDPNVQILKVEFDKQNPRLGSFELDWNEEFVEFLKSHGYTGNRPEEIVDAWLMDVCKNIAGEVPYFDNVRYIQRKDLGGGKTEFS